VTAAMIRNILADRPGQSTLDLVDWWPDQLVNSSTSHEGLAHCAEPRLELETKL
jgi:hypothetical protein